MVHTTPREHCAVGRNTIQYVGATGSWPSTTYNAPRAFGGVPSNPADQRCTLPRGSPARHQRNLMKDVGAHTPPRPCFPPPPLGGGRAGVSQVALALVRARHLGDPGPVARWGSRSTFGVSTSSTLRTATSLNVRLRAYFVTSAPAAASAAPRAGAVAGPCSRCPSAPPPSTRRSVRPRS